MIIIIIIVGKPADLGRTRFPGAGTGRCSGPIRTGLSPNNDVVLDATARRPFRVR